MRHILLIVMFALAVTADEPIDLSPDIIPNDDRMSDPALEANVSGEDEVLDEELPEDELGEDEAMDGAETVVFRPLFAHRQREERRRQRLLEAQQERRRNWN
ncbi:hypothetical protein R5R35_009816 [Gryllus longicercus]|uniref:Uncharacterized protein n=1 Tax=Gryllus longicercus TaxID=2509291 RepID=A0AAN9VN68_9ORTH